MDARDFRGLGRPAQEALRRRALCLVEREGMTQAQAALAVGAHRQTANIWFKRYRERGEDGVLDGRRVSPRRGKGLLTAEQAGQIRGWIAEGAPDGLGLPFALWTSRGRYASWWSDASGGVSRRQRCGGTCNAGA
jgi:transposase